MKMRFPAALTLLALAGSGLAYAAPDPQSPPPPQKIEKPAAEFTPADRAAFFDARVAALHTGLKLTPEQEKLWPPVEAAVRAAAASARERWEKMRSEPRPDSLIDRLRRGAENSIARGQNLQAVANAAAPLYATLSEEQKHRLPVLLHEIGPHGFHALWGRAEGWREGSRGARDAVEGQGSHGGKENHAAHGGMEMGMGMGGRGPHGGMGMMGMGGGGPHGGMGMGMEGHGPRHGESHDQPGQDDNDD